MVYYMISHGISPSPSLLLGCHLERPVEAVQGVADDLVPVLVELFFRGDTLDVLSALLLADLQLAEGVEGVAAIHGDLDVATVERLVEVGLAVLEVQAFHHGLRQGFMFILAVLPRVHRLVLLEKRFGQIHLVLAIRLLHEELVDDLGAEVPRLVLGITPPI
jgi:hypothetical protein